MHRALVLTCDDDLDQRFWFTGALGPSVVQLGAPTWLPQAYLGPVLQALDECGARIQACYFVRISAARGAFRLYALPLGCPTPPTARAPWGTMAGGLECNWLGQPPWLAVPPSDGTARVATA